jgi:hypothetical protein
VIDNHRHGGRMLKIFILILNLNFISLAHGEEKIIYEYKKYEKFDLGNLEVKGEIIAPGDLSVRERERKKFEIDLFNRTNFEVFLKNDLNSLR